MRGMKPYLCLTTAALFVADVARANSPADEFKDVLPRTATRSIPDSMNAFTVLIRLPAVPFEIEDKRRRKFFKFPTESSAGRIDRDFVEMAAAKSGDALHLIRQAMSMPDFENEVTADPYQKPALAERGSGIFFYVRLIAAQAVLQAESGKIETAWNDLTAIARLGLKMRHGRMDFATHAIGISCESLSYRSATVAAASIQSPALLKQWTADLLPFEKETEDCEFMMRDEFAVKVRTYGDFGKGGVAMKREAIRNWLRKMEPSLPREEKLLEERVDELMKEPTEAIQQEWNAADKIDLPGQLQGHAAFLRKLGKPDMSTLERFTKSLPEDPDDGSDSYRTGFEEGRQSALQWFSTSRSRLGHLRKCRTALAVRAWQLDHNHELPDRLEQLVPHYLPAVPLDPQDAKPLRYSKERRILWGYSNDPSPVAGETDKDKPGVLPLVKDTR